MLQTALYGPLIRCDRQRQMEQVRCYRPHTVRQDGRVLCHTTSVPLIRSRRDRHLRPAGYGYGFGQVADR